MSTADKTYSGQKSYHEMLVRAQALSPALLYIFCKILLSIQMDPKVDRPSIRIRASHEFFHKFSRNPGDCLMARFAREAFNNFAVWTGCMDAQGSEYAFVAELQFLEWLHTKDAVAVDDETRLVTIKL